MKRRQQGAVALEYILIVALVAIAAIGAFVLLGQKAGETIKKSSTTSHRALEP